MAKLPGMLETPGPIPSRFPESWWGQFELPRLTQALLLVLAAALIAWLDFVTGPYQEFGLFYNTIIILGALQFGARGLLFVPLCVLGYFFNAMALDGVDGYYFRPYNAMVRGTSFAVVGTVSVLLHFARARMQAHQRALEEAVSQQEAVLQCLPDTVLILDSTLRVHHVGGSYREHLGMEAADLLGQELAALRVSPALLDWLRAFASNPRGGEPVRIVDGDQVFEVVPAVVQGTGGDFQGWVLVLRDVTEQVRSSELLLARARSLAVQETRSRLARHLHDHVAQTMASIRMRLDLLTGVEEDPESRTRIVRTIQTALSAAIRDLRQTMWELRPTALERFPFVQALQTYLGDLQAHSGFEIRLKVEEPVRLEPEREVLLFYIIQEAVANAVKYSGSTGVDVRIERQEDVFAVEVCDDGVGFDVSKVEADPMRKSFGLQDMKDRARVMGAELEIRSFPGRGTCVWLFVPHDQAMEVRR